MRYRNDERETHINMTRTSNKMRIYTTEYHMMRKLDKYVEESDDWKVVEIARCKGEVVSKTYEAPRKLLGLRKKKIVQSEEQRIAAAERLRAYHHNKQNATKKADEVDEYEDCEDYEDDDVDDANEELDDSQEEQNTAANNEESNFQPELTRPKYKKREDVEPER